MIIERCYGNLPHARGDEPICKADKETSVFDLPHARGDEPEIYYIFLIAVFICPTHVGMNRGDAFGFLTKR